MSKFDDLEKLATLESKGILTSDEFQKQKDIILEKYSAKSFFKKIFLKYKECMTSKYLSFKGRAPRMEYWSFALIYFVIYMGLGMIEGLLYIPPFFSGLFVLFSLLPALGVYVRRYHDLGKNAWFAFLPFLYFIAFIASFPIFQGEENFVFFLKIGFGLFFVLTLVWKFILPCFKGDIKENKYGYPLV